MSAGATPLEWDHFDLILGLTDDMLPVVSDPAVPISPSSKIARLGQVPSVVNGKGEAIGLVTSVNEV